MKILFHIYSTRVDNNGYPVEVRQVLGLRQSLPRQKVLLNKKGCDIMFLPDLLLI